MLIHDELWPYAELTKSLRNYEAYYTIQQTAEEISGDVDWEAGYVESRDALLVRGSLAARMLPEIAQRLHLLADRRGLQKRNHT